MSEQECKRKMAEQKRQLQKAKEELEVANKELQKLRISAPVKVPKKTFGF